MNEQPHMQPPLIGAGIQLNSLALLVHISTVISLWGNLECQVTQFTMKGSKMKG